MNENENAAVSTTHAGPSPVVSRLADHDSRTTVLHALVSRLGGRCVITDDEFAEHFGRGVRVVKSGGEMVIEAID